MSEQAHVPAESLTDNEVRAVFDTLKAYADHTRRGQYEGSVEAADSGIWQTYQSSMEHTDNPRVGLFLAAGAAGSARAQMSGQLQVEFFDRFSQTHPDQELREQVDRFSRSAMQARQYPDGQEAISIQAGHIVERCLGDLANEQLPADQKDALFATVFYAAAQAGAGSPAEQMAQTQLPPLR